MKLSFSCIDVLFSGMFLMVGNCKNKDMNQWFVIHYFIAKMINTLGPEVEAFRNLSSSESAKKKKCLESFAHLDKVGKK